MAWTKAEVKQWIEKNAAWYSEHEEFPLCKLALEGVYAHCVPSDKADYVDFMQEQFYNFARRVFKRLKLDMRKDK